MANFPHPLGDCVLVVPELPPAYQQYKRYTHVITPDRYAYGPEDRPIWGKILAKGPICHARVKIGDRVLFGKWSGARLQYHDKEYIVVRDYDLLAIDE